MKLITRLFGTLLAALTTVGTAIAAVPPGVDEPNVQSPTTKTDLGTILANGIDALLVFAGAVAVLFLIIGGFRYVVSAGNEQQVESAKKTVLYAVLGLIVIFVAFVLIKVVEQALGVKSGFSFG